MIAPRSTDDITAAREALRRFHARQAHLLRVETTDPYETGVYPAARPEVPEPPREPMTRLDHALVVTVYGLSALAMLGLLYLFLRALIAGPLI